MKPEFNVFKPENIVLSDTELARILAPFGEDSEDELRGLAAEAASISAPKALWCAARVEETNENGVTICAVRFESALMAKNFASVGRVFPYICTCGTELEDWSVALDDPFTEYFADELKKLYLGKAVAALHSYLRERFAIEGHLTAMNPGSLAEWSLTSQKELFTLFGRQNVLDSIGVSLTESCLMLPPKTVDGIYFANAEGYENCQLCPIEDCPNRRKAQIK